MPYEQTVEQWPCASPWCERGVMPVNVTGTADYGGYLEPPSWEPDAGAQLVCEYCGSDNVPIAAAFDLTMTYYPRIVLEGRTFIAILRRTHGDINRVLAMIDAEEFGPFAHLLIEHMYAAISTGRVNRSVAIERVAEWRRGQLDGT